jgi:Polyketide cyclase / dehydrase and lipid transport
MKILKYILIALGILLASILVTGLFLPKEYKLSREVTINRNYTDVYNYVKYLKNQSHYNVWAQMDPNQITTYTGEDGRVGFTSAWKSEIDSVGAGTQTIVAMNEGKSIDYEIVFTEPFESTMQTAMLFEPVDGSTTKVTWNFRGDMNYPFNVMLLAYDMEKTLGKDLQKGLNTLKEILEKESASSSAKKLPYWQWSEDGWRWTQVRLKGGGC